MQAESLLIGLGTFGIGIAGFAAVATGLKQGNPTWTAAHSLRARAIVSTSLNVAFESVIPLILSYGIQNQGAAIRISSLVAATYLLVVVMIPRTRQLIRVGAWRNTSVRLTFAAGYLTVALLFANLPIGSVAVYALALWFQLMVPAVNFYSLIAEADRG